MPAITGVEIACVRLAKLAGPSDLPNGHSGPASPFASMSASRKRISAISRSWAKTISSASALTRGSVISALLLVMIAIE